MSIRSYVGPMLLLLACWSAGGTKADAAVPSKDGTEAASPRADAAVSLRDAVAQIAGAYRIEVTGLDKLGAEPPAWPSVEQAPDATLKFLLRDYGYIAELGAPAGSDGVRMPRHLKIVGRASDDAAGSSPAAAPAPAGAAAQAPSALSSMLAKAALSVQANAPQVAAPHAANGSIGGLSGAEAPKPLPATDATGMAALTRAAHASVLNLAASLQKACGTGAHC